MTNQEFKECPKELLLEGAKKSYQNALSLYNAAIRTSIENGFGVSNTLIILSVEECIKSIILTAGYFNVEIPFDVKPYFSSHKMKHMQANDIQPVVTKLWQVKHMFVEILKKRKSTFSLVLNLTLAWVFFTLGIDKLEVQKFTDWWNDANDLKNDGLYVGFFNGKWKSPMDISNETFQKTLEIAKPFVESLEIIMELKPDDYKLLNGSILLDGGALGLKSLE